MRIRTTLAGLLVFGASLPALAADADPNIMEARGIVKQFFGSLKGELQAAMKSGGPVHAIEVCNSKAPEITRNISTDSGWKVARTSLKIRNTSNIPLAWERKVMNDFEQRKAAGEKITALEFSEVIEKDGKKAFRYMKAIPTGKVCLNCHGGDNLKPEVEAKLKDLYPADQARGFKEGDIRGAFTLEKVL